MTDDKGVVASRKGVLETCGPPADEQAKAVPPVLPMPQVQPASTTPPKPEVEEPPKLAAEVESSDSAVEPEATQISMRAHSPQKGASPPPLLHRSSSPSDRPQLPALSLLSKPGGPRVSEFNDPDGSPQ